MGIEKLLIKQAKLSDLRRELKAKGCKEAAKCTRLTTKDFNGFEYTEGESCIAMTYSGWRDECFDCAVNHGSGPEFEEVWQESVEEGEICQHCQNVRSLKRQRMDAGRSLAGVRAAITRVGRRLAKEAADPDWQGMEVK